MFSRCPPVIGHFVLKTDQVDQKHLDTGVHWSEGPQDGRFDCDKNVCYTILTT